MDIHELRSAFILSETLTEKVQSFKEKRLSMIIANESHIQFNNNEILVLFLIPFESFQPGKIFDIKRVFNVGRLSPLHSSSWIIIISLEKIIKGSL